MTTKVGVRSAAELDDARARGGSRVSDLPEGAVAPGVAGAENPRHGALTVAIIDDDASMCRSSSRLLRLAGYHPSAFRSAEAFLADAGRADSPVCSTDIQLGGMSGLEMQRAWHARGDGLR